MKKWRRKMKIIAIISIIFISSLMSGCTEAPQEIVPGPTPEPMPLTEIEKLELFLEQECSILS